MTEEVVRRTEGHKSTLAAMLRWLLVVGLLAGNLALLAMGLLAAAVGGGLTVWGSGAGGLDGWPDLSMTVFSLVVGVAAAAATYRERRSILIAVAVLATGFLIGTVYLMVAHLADPCDRNWWDSATTVGDTPLCSPFGDIAERFHLLLHATFGALAASAAALIYRRKSLFDWWPLLPRSAA